MASPDMTRCAKPLSASFGATSAGGPSRSPQFRGLAPLALAAKVAGHAVDLYRWFGGLDRRLPASRDRRDHFPAFLAHGRRTNPTRSPTLPMGGPARNSGAHLLAKGQLISAAGGGRPTCAAASGEAQRFFRSDSQTRQVGGIGLVVDPHGRSRRDCGAENGDGGEKGGDGDAHENVPGLLSSGYGAAADAASPPRAQGRHAAPAWLNPRRPRPATGPGRARSRAGSAARPAPAPPAPEARPRPARRPAS